jgi:uncharacterized protein YukJ
VAISGYGVLVGRAVAARAENGQQSPHYQVQVNAAGVQYRIAVNVRSAQNPPDLLYVADEMFTHPVLTALTGLPEGFSALPSRPGGAALDYIRGNLFDPAGMRSLPANLPGPDNDLSDRLAHFVNRAISDPTALVYAFGQRWGPENSTPDKVFGFSPGNGVHDIHMNQGNNGRFAGDNGVWQDGGLLLHFPGQNQWVAIFLAFQSQAWHTDDTTGNPLGGGAPAQPGHPGVPGQAPRGERDGSVRIVGALVNPVGPAPEAETVTLLNTTPGDIDLTGWALLDRMKHSMPLTGITISAGDTARIPVQPPVQLGNQGGLITVLDPGGLKVDGVAYTKGDAGQEGRTIAF